ncbi:hypothetical protein AB837_00485 [bacterium AB1]|nr:hypothetical protein AB837_00485 [bacterium AB1]
MPKCCINEKCDNKEQHETIIESIVANLTTMTTVDCIDCFVEQQAFVCNTFNDCRVMNESIRFCQEKINKLLDSKEPYFLRNIQQKLPYTFITNILIDQYLQSLIELINKDQYLFILNSQYHQNSLFFIYYTKMIKIFKLYKTQLLQLTYTPSLSCSLPQAHYKRNQLETCDHNTDIETIYKQMFKKSRCIRCIQCFFDKKEYFTQDFFIIKKYLINLSKQIKILEISVSSFDYYTQISEINKVRQRLDDEDELLENHLLYFPNLTCVIITNLDKQKDLLKSLNPLDSRCRFLYHDPYKNYFLFTYLKKLELYSRKKMEEIKKIWDTTPILRQLPICNLKVI